MTAAELKACVCEWVNSLGVTAVQEPSNHPAPDGLHVAVSLQSVEQYGRDMVQPEPDEDAGAYVTIQYVATLRLYEVDGDGETLRSVRNSFGTPSFAEHVADTFPDSEDGRDLGFSVWELGSLQAADSQDGDGNWVRQWTFTATCQFNDFVSADAPRLLSVGGTLTDGEEESEVSAAVEDSE